MEIFISWSGERSRKVAEALGIFLEGVIPDAKVWISSKDVPAGSDWFASLTAGLERSGYGILCLTKGNLSAPWVAFEAGAHLKSFGKSGVCPFLIDVSISHLILPFSVFHAVHSDKDGARKLVESIMAQLPEAQRRKGAWINNSISAYWPKLNKTLQQVRMEDDPPSELEQLKEQINLQATKIDSMHELIKEMLSQLRLNVFGKGLDKADEI